MTEAAYLVDFEWRYLFVNEAAAEASRSTIAAMVGDTLMGIHGPVEDRPVFQIFKQSMADRVVRHIEAPWTYPDGKTVWFDIRLQPHPEGLFIRSTDITARKLAEEEARSTKARLRAVVDASPVPVLAIDLQGNVLLWSPAAERAFGWTAAEVEGKPNPLVPPDMRAEYEQQLARTADGTKELVTIRLARDGRHIPVHVTTAPLLGPNSERIGTVATVADLSEHQALRSALVESEQRFAAVFDESPIGKMLVRASDRHIVEANRALLELFDVKRADIIDKPATVLAESGNFDRMGFWAQLMEHGRVTDYPLQILTSNGAARDVLLSGELVTIAGVEYSLSVLQDVTARLATERALRESDERFRQISETIEEVFWLSDLEKNQVVYVSPAYERTWGRSAAALAENPREWIEAVHPDDRARVLDAALTQQRLGAYDETYRIVRPDGEIRWIRDRGFPVRDSAGRVIRVAGAAQDVTAERQLERQLRHTQKMESIGLLAGGVAHDFNNLLTVIGGNCDLLAEMPDQDREGATLVIEIRDAAARAASLTRQLLSFSRREVTEPKVVDLDSSIMETEKMLRRLLGEDIDLSLDLGQDQPRVKVDPGSFGQLLVNLAVNARDAMPRGGDLVISTCCVMLTEEQRRVRPTLAPGQYVLLSVADTGGGIPAEILSRVFEPFFTTKMLGRGTGLGLSVVHGIVEQSGGFIEVESEVGAGTTFHTYLPLVDGPASMSAAAGRGAAVIGVGTVLFVEDEAGIRRVATRALERQGYAILEASDGVHALEVARRHPGTIQLLITDVVMPRMGGRELAVALRVEHPELRVLYMSGYMDDAVVRHGVRHAEVSFLPKPYDLISLRQKVRQVLAQPAGEEGRQG